MGDHLPLLALGVLFSCWQSLGAYVLNGVDRQKASAAIALGADGVRLVLTCLTVGQWGMGGYAVSFVLASLVGGRCSAGGRWPRPRGWLCPFSPGSLPPTLAACLAASCGDLMETVLLRAEAGVLPSALGGMGFGLLCCTWRPSKPWGCGAENRSGPRRGIVFSPWDGVYWGNHPGGFLCRRLWGRYPFGWVAPKPPWGARPRGPLPGGGPHFSREMGERGPGALPPGPPWFYGPLAAARLFWGLCHIVPVVGLFRRPSSYPDLETFFHKMLFQHIFPGNASQIGLRISEETAPRTDPGQQSPKRASGNERPIKRGGGGPPRDSLRPGFL